MSAPILLIDRLSVAQDRPGDAKILHDISFELARGETLGIVGESGCGKSTLLSAILGGLKKGLVSTGSIRFKEQEIVGAAATALTGLRGRSMALVPQNAAVTLTPSMTIAGHFEEQLAYKTDITPKARADRAAELIVAMRLPNPTTILARYPHELSGGQQQRVGIALALAGKPALLLLDEPTTALDVTTKRAILALLTEIAEREQLAMIYVSHDIGVITRMSHRVGVMYAGELVEEGPATAVLTSPRHPYTEGLLASVPRISARFLPSALPGSPPGPTASRQSCAFEPRCKRADGRCQSERPAPLVHGLRVLACHHPLPDNTSPASPRIAEAVAPSSPSGALLQLDGIEIAWSKAGLFDRLAGRVPPATVTNINFDLKMGEVLGLIGESGSGKSTVLRTIAGLWPQRKGTIIFGADRLQSRVTARSPDQRRHIQLVFQNPEDSLNPRQTVGEILARPLGWYRGLSGADLTAEIASLIDAVRLGPRHIDCLPGELSGGEKQRVAIARALAAKPKLLLCDEITSALDVSVQAAIMELLANLRQETGVAMLFVTHDMALIRHFADRLLILQTGRIRETGATDTIMAAPSHPYTAELIQAAREEELPGLRRM